MKERIHQLISALGISDRSFSMRIGKSEAFARTINKNIGSDVIGNILREFPNVNAYWLLTGEGEMFQHSNEDNKKAEYHPEGEIKSSTVNESPSVYGLSNDININDTHYKENSLLNSINNMSQAMMVSASAEDRNSKNMEKLIDLLAKNIEIDKMNNE